MAYTTVTILRNDPLPDGRRHLQVRFTGDAGEAGRTAEVDVSTKAEAKAWAIGKIAQFNSALTAGSDVTMQPGQSFDLTPDPSPAPSSDEQWLAKVNQLIHAYNLKLAWTSAGIAIPQGFATDFATLATQVATGFSGGYTTQRGALL